MENYKLLHKLGKGAQGSVFLAEDKLTNQKCVLKKVECSDEVEANKAFKEAIALQQLKHSYICGYREFFVIWDQEEHAIYVCIVMDYYKLGDLEHALKKKRMSKTQLEDSVLKKWLGQMVEALHYVHAQNMIHRDLKPSNIFMKDDLSVAIGDFGVATVMGNIRTVTRTAVGSMSWMAPEVLDTTSHYDERTDVWSLGCIILEMATCGILDTAQISGVLFQLKDNHEMLEDVLERVAEQYSPDLCQLIRTTLRRSFRQRPTTKEMVDLPYVQECLSLSNSALYKGPKKDGVMEVKPVPTDGGIDAIIVYMKEDANSEASQIEALKQLKEFTSSNEHSVNDDGKSVVLQTMKEFASSLEVQSLCCHVLGNTAVTVSEGDVLFSKDYIQPVCLAMRSHAGSVELQSSASAVIMSLSSDETAAEVLGQVGGIQDILAAMRLFPNNVEIVSNCCTALWSLSVIEGNMAIITKERGVQDVCNALATHNSCKDLVDAACSALWSLTMEDDNLSLMADLGVVELLLQAIDDHVQDPGVTKFACAALTSLAEVHEISAFHVLHTENSVTGVPILLKALSTHSTNSEVVESVATLFQELASYDEIQEELRSLKVGNVLAKISSKFSQIQGDEADDVKAALANAQEALRGQRPTSAHSLKRPHSATKTKQNTPA